MKSILVIGNGAREHVIAETLKRSPQEVLICVYGKAMNPGLRSLSSAYELGDLKDLDHIKTFAVSQKCDFAIVGPEDPLASGVADVLAEAGIPTVGPKKAPGQLESSKSFARDLLAKYDIIGNPLFQIFTSPEGMEEFVQRVGENFVVKADGLRSGKGVKVSGDHFSTAEDGLAYARECLKEDGRVVLEEKLIGQEFSLMSFCDGNHTVAMPAVQDHKRAYENDLGSNTGGMGSYSDVNHSLPFLDFSDIEAARAINQNVAEAVAQETGTPFQGILYGGFMAVRDGIRLIEYNARFGDPEVMNVLPLLETDFVALCEAILSGTLDQISLQFSEKATVCKYVVPNGYPDAPVKNEKITVGVFPQNVRAYYGSVDQRDDALILSGSRAIGVMAVADSLEEAERFAENATNAISGPVFHRKDIGTKALIQKKIMMMKALRNSQRI